MKLQDKKVKSFKKTHLSEKICLFNRSLKNKWTWEDAFQKVHKSTAINTTKNPFKLREK